MRCERIVIVVDFSEHSIAAAQWIARRFAPRAELVFVHVLELPPPPAFWSRRRWLRAYDIETRRTGATARLRQLGAQIGSACIGEEVRIGRPEDAVLRVAGELEADLIVIGSHGERAGIWNRFGSTAERILGGAEVPVLIAHGAPRAMPRVLLAAVDDSPTTDQVIAFASALTQRLGASGLLLHVLPSAAHHLPVFPVELVVHDRGLVEARNEMIHAAYGRLRERIANESSALSPLVLQGHPPAVILREARLAGADLIVLGRERKGSIRRRLFGSAAGAVIRGASCPVLVIPSSGRGVSRTLEREADAYLDGALR